MSRIGNNADRPLSERDATRGVLKNIPKRFLCAERIVAEFLGEHSPV